MWGLMEQLYLSTSFKILGVFEVDTVPYSDNVFKTLLNNPDLVFAADYNKDA
jgi:hypothetical protein